INSDGTYTYSVTKPNDMTGWEPPYGKVDSFRLVTEDANCKTTIETLNIKIGTHTAIDDFNDVSVAMENLVTTEKVIDGVSAATKELSKDFTVAENTLTSATMQVNTTTLATRLEYSIINKDTGVVVATNTGNATRAIDVTIANLEPGNYTLEINRVEGLGHLKINDSSFTTTSQHLNEYTPTAINPVTGVLLENDAGSHNVAELKIGNKIVFVSAPNKGADSIEIEGLYGTLTVQKNGTYSYTPSGEAYGIEIFTYETTSVTGIKETATLEINVAVDITASKYDDVITSTAGNDTFEGGLGSDTLNFDLLDEDDATGGNGVDTWTDFHFGEVGTDANADVIDISELLLKGSGEIDLNEFLKLEHNAEEKTLTLSIDRDGAADGFGFEELLVLTEQ